MKRLRQYLNERFGSDDIFDHPYGPFYQIWFNLQSTLAQYGFAQWNDLENWFNGQNGESMEYFYDFALEWLDINGDGYFGADDALFFDFMDEITTPFPYGNIGIELPQEFISIYGYGLNGGVFDMNAFLGWWNGYIQDVIAQGKPYPSKDSRFLDYIENYIAQGDGYFDQSPWSLISSGIPWEEYEGETQPSGEPWQEIEGGLGSGWLPLPSGIIPPGVLETIGIDPNDGSKGNPIDSNRPPEPSYDFDNDGDVDFDDLLYLLSNYTDMGFDYDDLLDLLSEFGNYGLLANKPSETPRLSKQLPSKLSSITRNEK